MAALQSGATKVCLDMMTEFAKERFSFGQPIGSYQGIKHPIAVLFSRYSVADAHLRVATEAADISADNVSPLAASARLLFSDLYYESATRNQFVHGGLGFTWEHDAHLYTKNALTLGQICGGRQQQRDRLADLLAL